METLFWFCGAFIGFILISSSAGEDGACYQFKKKGRVVIADNNDIATDAHFSLKFKTRADSGVLYFASGTYNRQRVFDYEGLYIVDGFLYYFLFNPGEYSIGASQGFTGVTKTTVNDGDWHTVEFCRNRQVETTSDDGELVLEYQTSLVLDGEVQSIETVPRDNVSIFFPISLGRDPYESDRKDPIPGFKGSIKDFKDMSRDRFLTNGTKEGSVSHCIDVPDAQ